MIPAAAPLAILLLATAAAAKSLPGVFDQRQDGKVNVQIDVKDLQIVALLPSDVIEDYMSYDYAYDYADFTIKPRPTPSKPTSKPTSSSTTTEASIPSSTTTTTTTTTTAAAAEKVSSSSVDVTTTTSPIVAEVTTTSPIGAEATSATSAIAETSPADPTSPGEEASPIAQPSTVEPPYSSSLVPAASEPRKRCPVGFHLKSGRCFKRRQSMISPRFALMKLAPTLLDKTKAWSRHPATESS